LELTWEGALDAAEDRDGWGRCIARCATLDGMYSEVRDFLDLARYYYDEFWFARVEANKVG